MSMHDLLRIARQITPGDVAGAACLALLAVALTWGLPMAAAVFK